jgi:hypothetical protein
MKDELVTPGRRLSILDRPLPSHCPLKRGPEHVLLGAIERLQVNLGKTDTLSLTSGESEPSEAGLDYPMPSSQAPLWNAVF